MESTIEAATARLMWGALMTLHLKAHSRMHSRDLSGYKRAFCMLVRLCTRVLSRLECHVSISYLADQLHNLIQVILLLKNLPHSRSHAQEVWVKLLIKWLQALQHNGRFTFRLRTYMQMRYLILLPTARMSSVATPLPRCCGTRQCWLSWQSNPGWIEKPFCEPSI